MIITPASLDAAYTGFSHSFQQGVQSAASFWAKLAMQTGSDTEQEVYSFMSRIPRLREWVGERVYNDLAANTYTLPNKDYEDSFEVPRTKFEDDKFGIYMHSAQALGQAVEDDGRLALLLGRLFVLVILGSGLGLVGGLAVLGLRSWSATL